MKTKIISKRIIPATPEQIWHVIESPEHMPAWNNKCVKITKIDHLEVGGRFEGMFKLSKQPQSVLGEIIHKDPFNEIRCRYQFGEKQHYSTETLALTKVSSNQTCLTQTVDLSHAGLPFLIQLLVIFLGKFGRKRGTDPLEEIEGIATME